jgi:hypothetical protein
MNRKFLGDAYDCWKGWLIKTLQDEKLVSDLAVDPMFTDPKPWNDDDLAAYARLLHVERGKIISHSFDLVNRATRADYFNETMEKHRGDLFLDPDTGVQTGGLHPPERYVAPLEIAELLQQVPKRLVIVYQHGALGKSVSDRVDGVTKVLCERWGQLGWSSYESNTVAMLFLSGSHDRTQRVAQHFGEVLGRRNAELRIREGHR